MQNLFFCGFCFRAPPRKASAALADNDAQRISKEQTFTVEGKKAQPGTKY
jgi:hypothetical protein